MPDPSRTLREFAERFYDANDPRRDQIMQLAADLERQHNQQNNQLSVALGQAELAIEDKIEQMAAALRGEIAALASAAEDSKARQHQMLAMLEALQDELRALRGTGDQSEANG